MAGLGKTEFLHFFTSLNHPPSPSQSAGLVREFLSLHAADTPTHIFLVAAADAIITPDLEKLQTAKAFDVIDHAAFILLTFNCIAVRRDVAWC